LQRKLQDPDKRAKMYKYAMEMGGVLGRAKNAWKRMSPQGKAVIARLQANDDWVTNLKNAQLSPEDQKLSGSVAELGNMILKERSGSAVTEPEMARFASESGFAGATIDMFNDPGNVDAWLDRNMAKYRDTIGAWDRAYDGLFTKKGAL
jgi:hypothetical protein